mmetsp:Transcript_28048/g.81072  ORF Transcript_28048/g.81072 Transcript_28048/m.81072 type:complete len:265 (+) Transcript_28048:970-1764(+)
MHSRQNEHLTLRPVAVLSFGIGIESAHRPIVPAHLLGVLCITGLGRPKLGLGRFAHSPTVSLLDIPGVSIQLLHDTALSGLKVGILNPIDPQRIDDCDDIFTPLVTVHLGIQRPIGPGRSLAQLRPPTPIRHARRSGGVEEHAPQDRMGLPIGKPRRHLRREVRYAGPRQTYDVLAIINGEGHVQIAHRHYHGGTVRSVTITITVATPRSRPTRQAGVGPLGDDGAVGIDDGFETVDRLLDGLGLDDGQGRSLSQAGALEIRGG